jgi:AcrR family transcriptional regulator
VRPILRMGGYFWCRLLDRQLLSIPIPYGILSTMDNREAILARALELWGKRGYDAVGVQEIVDAAGVTKPTLYHYFGSKRGLLDALIDTRWEALRNALVPAAAYDGDIVRTLESIVRGYFAFARANPEFYRLLLAFSFAPPDSDERLASASRTAAQLEALEGLFEAAAWQHGNMRGRQKAYAATFLGMISTYIGLAVNGHATLDDELVYLATHQFMHGIFS